MTDQWFYDITTQNFEKINPNGWNPETGGNPRFQRFFLTWVPPVRVMPGIEKAFDIILPMAAKRLELDPENNVLTMDLREDLTWGDGARFDAENVVMHADLLRTQIELAVEGGDMELGESSLPLSVTATDRYTIENQLQPGNAILRTFEALNQGNLRHVHRTHPKRHREFVEQARDATTVSEMRSAVKSLTTATFPAEETPTMALSGFQASEWDPEKIIFEARPEWPWGIDVHDVDRVFKGIRWVSVTEDTQELNAAVAGEKSYLMTPSKTALKRLGEEWESTRFAVPNKSMLYFSPDSIYGKKTDRSLALRKAFAYLFDSGEFAQINDLVAAYEQTTGITGKGEFKAWIGEDEFESWTNYGKADTGYVFEERGFEKLREAGFERKKDGTWVDAGTGSPLAPKLLGQIRSRWGITRPVLNNVGEQFNRHGIKMSTEVPQSETFENAVQNFEFEVGLFTDQCTMTPHPFMGFREDCGLGSPEGLPAQIASWDWRNGHKRVEVPMPVGNPDGELTTYNWDKNVLEMAELQTDEAIEEKVRELSWVINQWVPGIYLTEIAMWYATNTNHITLADDVTSKVLRWAGGVEYNLAAGYFQPPA